MDEPYFLMRYRRMVQTWGHDITPDSKILDFCCGTGTLVQEFRRAGFDAHGFEPFSGYVPPDDPAFSTLGWPNPYQVQPLDPANPPSLAVDWRSNFRLPYPDASFDFIFSTEVMEHVSDHDAALAELRRVLMPDGIAIHSFPSRYRLMEPHIRVPLGGVFKSYPWYRLWLSIAPFNALHVRFSRANVARMAIWYARGSLCYRRPGDLARIASAHFGRAAFVPELWEADARRGPPRLPWLYTRIRNVIWMMDRPRRPPAATLSHSPANRR